MIASEALHTSRKGLERVLRKVDVSSLIGDTQQKELRELKGRPWRFLIWGGSTLLLVLFLWAFVTGVTPPDPLRTQELERARSVLLSSGPEWGAEFVEDQYRYISWFRAHGIEAEERIFERVAAPITNRLAAKVRSDNRNHPFGFLRSIFFSLHQAPVRVTFVVLASWRLWLAIVLVACALSGRCLQIHREGDLLGTTGNGRLFFSGIRIGLDSLDADGTPSTLLPGLAVPSALSAADARSSALGRILERFEALSPTSGKLAAIVGFYRHFPAYAAGREDHTELERYFQAGSLPENAAAILRSVLELHAKYRRGESLDTPPLAAVSLPLRESSSVRVSSEQHAEQVGQVLHRVLTPAMRRQIAGRSPVEVAVAVLACEAAKVMTYSREGERWVRRSNFLQLNARAILHSLVEFAQEFSSSQRTMIRQAIIFADRIGPFAPVRFPQQMSDHARALRQWCEVVCALPHQLSRVADDVELFSLISEGHQRWSGCFFEAISSGELEKSGTAYATQANLCLVPLAQVVRLLRAAIAPASIRRIEELLSRTHQARGAKGPKGPAPEAAGISADESVLEPRDRAVAPLTPSEIAQLAELHQISVEELRDWSALRLVLAGHGWLARRMGDCSVPPASVIMAVLKISPGTQLPEMRAVQGVKGLVPLRGGRLAERFGASWRARFIEASRAVLVENSEEFEKRLANIDEATVVVPEEGGMQA